MKDPIPAYCQFKTELVKERSQYLTDTAGDLLIAMVEYCEEAGLPIVVTDSVSTAQEDRELSRVSDEHSTGRAFDLSIHGWLERAIEDFISHFEKHFMCVAAIGKKTNEPRLIFRHNNGHGDHLHVQIARIYAVKDPLKQTLV